jgi:hypothetical protein
MIAMFSFRSSSLVLSYVLSYKFARSLLLRSQNTICGFQQKEAGVTPEARRDRAAILRHDGVAPASGRVLAALHFLAVSVASACAFFLLSASWGEVGVEIRSERCLLGTFHGHIYLPMRVSLKQRRLSVHNRKDNAHLRGGSEL